MGEEQELNEKAQILEKWLQNQNELPKHMEHILLRRFVHYCGSDVEKAKELIRLGFEFRTKYEHIFIKRDPLSPEAQINFEITVMIPLPIFTKENERILFYRLADCDPNKIDFIEAVKGFFMSNDVRFSFHEPVLNGFTAEEIPIIDLDGLTLKHITKMSFSLLKTISKHFQEAYPVRPTQIHLINCSPYLDRFMTLLRPILKSQVHSHLPNSTTLYEHVPQELLPNEYGGKAGNIADLKKKWIAQIESKREYLANEDNWRSKTVNNKTSNEETVNHIETFKYLSID